MQNFIYFLFIYFHFFSFQLIVFYIFKFIKYSHFNTEILKNNLIEGNENGFIIVENKFIFIKNGQYILKGINNDINIIIKCDNVFLFFNNAKYNSNFYPTILIENNISNTVIYFNNSIISSNFNSPILKLKKNSNILIYACSLIIKGNFFYQGENDNNIYIKGLVKYNEEYFYKNLKLNIIKNYSLYYENFSLMIKDFELQIHPKINNVILNETIYQFLFSNFSNLLINNFVFFKLINNLFNFEEKIIISLSTSKNKINNLYKSLKILINNTYKPKKIILNLSIDDFPNKNLDLPKNILKIINYGGVEIFWIRKNKYIFNNLIPTINRFKKDLIITIKDEVVYSYDFIEKILKYYIKYGYNRPISFSGIQFYFEINNTKIEFHYSAASIVKYEFFEEKINELFEETSEQLIKTNIKYADDILYTYAALLNGYQYLCVKDYSINFINFQIYNFSNNNFMIIYNILKNYIFQKYNLTLEYLIVNNFELTKLNYLNNLLKLL